MNQTPPNKVIDGIFERFDNVDGLISSYRRFLAESLVEVLTKEVNNYETPFETRMAMLSALKERLDEK